MSTASIIQSIETQEIDGVWCAHLNHHILGKIDGRSTTEQWAIDELLANLKTKCEQRNRDGYARLRERFPNYFAESRPA